MQAEIQAKRAREDFGVEESSYDRWLEAEAVMRRFISKLNALEGRGRPSKLVPTNCHRGKLA